MLKKLRHFLSARVWYDYPFSVEFKHSSDKDGWRRDGKALRQDWQKVGDYLRNVMPNER